MGRVEEWKETRSPVPSFYLIADNCFMLLDILEGDRGNDTEKNQSH